MGQNRFHQIKDCLIAQTQVAVPEATISGNWRSKIHDMVGNLPFITVRISPENMWDVYDRNIGEASGRSGSITDAFFSLHIFHSNCCEEGPSVIPSEEGPMWDIDCNCEKGKYAQDVASRIIDHIIVQPSPVGFDIMNVSARESEPSRGAHLVSRMIITGVIQIKRID